VAPTAAPGTQLGSAPVDVAWMASQWPGFEQVIASYGPSPLTSTLSIRRLGNGTVIDYPGLWRRIMPGYASAAGREPPV
jgi:hypothetical protein